MITERNEGTCKVRVGTNIANSTPFKFSSFAGGHLHVPAGEPAGMTLTYHIADSPNEGATFRPAYNNSGAAVTQTIGGGQAIELPPTLYAAHQIKVVTSALSGGTYVDYLVTMKS